MTTRAAKSSRPAADRPSSIAPAELHSYHLNPRRGNIPLIVDSLKAHGQYKPLVVNIGTMTGRPNEVLAGNQTLAAAMKMGLAEVAVHWVDYDDDQAARVVLVDNRASDKGGYDQAELTELLGSLDDLAGTGYSAGDLTKLLNGLEATDGEGLTDPDYLPRDPVEPRTKRGYVWLLGPHRLVCGNSTEVDVLRAAAGGDDMIEACWTDPPYGVEYVGKTKDKLRIQNDDKPGLAGLIFEAFQAAATVLRPGAAVYVAHADTERLTFEAALREAGFLVRQNLVWVKNTLVLGRSDYQYKHEPVLELEAPERAADPEAGSGFKDALDEALAADQEGEPVDFEAILYGFTPGGQGRLGRGGDRWYGNNKQTTVFEVAKPAASRDHPTMKPVELIVKMLRNSVVKGGTVLDLFAGSGSTLIACHQLGLIARLVELDPTFCDVICRRYQEHTGVMPILESSGAPVSFVAEGS